MLDTKKEHIAVTEANKLGIPIVAVVDTNCDPDVIQYVIPGNDDAIRSGTLMCRVIADAVEEGRLIASKRNAQAARPWSAAPRTRRASPPSRPRPATPAARAQAEREARLAAPAAADAPDGRRGPCTGRRRRRHRPSLRRPPSPRPPPRQAPLTEALAPEAEIPAPAATEEEPAPWLTSPPRTSRPCARPPAPG